MEMTRGLGLNDNLEQGDVTLSGQYYVYIPSFMLLLGHCSVEASRIHVFEKTVVSQPESGHSAPVYNVAQRLYVAL